ncbi:outer membrane protein [Xanthobacter tagetidis]|uniref:Porin family protein n=1 Tax=Xanthobacter tagetidis TaxID=60216 RepID=A0A3L7AL13_9HYPH|nr:outer membrane protein [Xanthobacter tagetidis]MBB6306880.1 outer membrane immunogenic protein [Xanthobacter tagetidis]RLP80052.1 porin family protein [Xanthobacter tagetidis]
MARRLVSSLSVSTALLLALGAAGGARAADMGYGAPRAYVQPVSAFTNWTGFYIGANAGYGWGTSNVQNPDGFLGGFQAGYNFQLGNPFMIGIEADFDFAGISGGGFSLDNLGTVRARGGFTFDRVLFYGTAGFAWGQGSFDVMGLSSSRTQSGWTIGAGLEMALDRNWSAKFEYLYFDLGSSDFRTVWGPRSVGFDGGVLRGGVNYRF